MQKHSLVKFLAALCTIQSDSIYPCSHWIKSLRGEGRHKSCLMWGSKPWQVCKASLLESCMYTHTHTHTVKAQTNTLTTTDLQPAVQQAFLNQLCQSSTLCTSHCSSTVKYYHLVWCLLLQLPFKQTDKHTRGLSVSVVFKYRTF